MTLFGKQSFVAWGSPYLNRPLRFSSDGCAEGNPIGVPSVIPGIIFDLDLETERSLPPSDTRPSSPRESM